MGTASSGIVPKPNMIKMGTGPWHIGGGHNCHLDIDRNRRVVRIFDMSCDLPGKRWVARNRRRKSASDSPVNRWHFSRNSPVWTTYTFKRLDEFRGRRSLHHIAGVASLRPSGNTNGSG